MKKNDDNFEKLKNRTQSFLNSLQKNLAAEIFKCYPNIRQFTIANCYRYDDNNYYWQSEIREINGINLGGGYCVDYFRDSIADIDRYDEESDIVQIATAVPHEELIDFVTCSLALLEQFLTHNEDDSNILSFERNNNE